MSRKPRNSECDDGSGLPKLQLEEKCEEVKPNHGAFNGLLSRNAGTVTGILTLVLILPCIILTDSFWRPTLPNHWVSLQNGADTPQLPGDPRGDTYLLGVGKADITGPCVELNMMGYADPNQLGTGLRQRLYSRAFIVADPHRPSDRFVYLVLDTQSGDTAVRYGILSGLEALGPQYASYGHKNVAVTGTHSHSGPGAWLNYLLPQITSKGFDHQSYQAIVDGALLSIRRAHESMEPGFLSVGSTKVFGANINRSLFAYLANPEEERAKYNTSTQDDGSVEKELTLLKFQRASDAKNIGVLTWFPTHGTSMHGNNTLISGDNKGVAADLFEKSLASDDSAAQGFVAGFSQASVGDTSPNVLGAWCEDGTGRMCSFENSTCSDGKSQQCHARGPMFRANDEGASSCYEIGKRMYEPAKQLYEQLNKSPEPVRGGLVRSFHRFHNMSNYTFSLPNGTHVKTCPAALGYSFAAGTSDGPGAFDFTQHDGGPNNTSPVWKVVSGSLKKPSEEQVSCQAPKPILLDVGEISNPYEWTPNIVDVQAFRVGQMVIIVSPGEATTMAGRRWKESVRDALGSPKSSSPQDETTITTQSPVVVLGGPANSYTHYITTEEEYGIQRYEGASTLYGPHTLNAYINVTLSLISYLEDPSSPPSHPMEPEQQPPDNSNKSLSFIPSVLYDGKPLFKNFGDIVEDVKPIYHYYYYSSSYGANTTTLSTPTIVSATFVGANPRTNLRLEQSYAVVEMKRKRRGKPVFVIDGGEEEEEHDDEDLRIKQRGQGEEEETEEQWEWIPIRDDSDWHLIFRWRRTNEVLGTSEVEISWDIAGEEKESRRPEPGHYRLRYFGDAKGVTGSLTPFEGMSGEFELVG